MRKHALIVGIGAYLGEASLQNPPNDAQDVAAQLESIGFRIDVLLDEDTEGVARRLQTFGTALAKADVGLFFFAGHGMQIGGENYLAVTNTDFSDELSAKYSSIALNHVLDLMDAGKNRTSIVILDACRNNPYERAWRAISGRGLAPVYAPKGTIIAYATSPGQIASDGVGRNGAFTSALLHHIGSPDITIEEVFKRTRNTLSSVTNGKQISWEHTSLMGDFHFNYTYVTEELKTSYSDGSLADGEYHVDPQSPVREAITDLRSHNWHSQNPAVHRLSREQLERAKIDDLFVLGRNIYQAACGSANRAMEYMQDLPQRLKVMSGQVAFHVLNGITYEVYFDSYGSLREHFKTSYLSEVCETLEMDEHNESMSFIVSALRPHDSVLFFYPGEKKNVVMDVHISPIEDQKPAVTAVCMAGEPVLYAADGESYYDIANEYTIKRSRQQIKELIAESAGVPEYRLDLTFVGGDDQEMLFPYAFSMRRLSA